MNYRVLKPAAAALLLASSLSSCAGYHTRKGISYMMDEDKALTAETAKYRQGEWKNQRRLTRKPRRCRPSSDAAT